MRKIKFKQAKKLKRDQRARKSNRSKSGTRQVLLELSSIVRITNLQPEI